MKIPVIVFVLAVTMFLVLAGGSVVLAQDGGTVTADDVNNVAKKLFCPVCENIPLDTCGTAACAQWRDEIRIQLESGRTEKQVIDDFVHRFGDRVIGTPQDPTLRALSLVTPWLLSALALLVAGFTFIRWRLNQSNEPEFAPLAPANNTPLADYRARLEQDLAESR
jgi:cytochrome c-type biogenesis protein CcmH